MAQQAMCRVQIIKTDLAGRVRETLASDLPHRRGSRRRAIEWIALLALLVAVLLFGVNFGVVTVSGHSMEPTFRDGQDLLFWKTAGIEGYHPGDVILFRDDAGELLLKRIAYLQTPGHPMPDELWTPRGSLKVRVLLTSAGGASEFPGYRLNQLRLARGLPIERLIYVLGDNTWQSEDSRDFGPIAPSQVLGKVVLPSGAVAYGSFADPPPMMAERQPARSPGFGLVAQARSRDFWMQIMRHMSHRMAARK